MTALATLFITAPYGRHARTGWGPTIPGTLGWIAMESVAVLTIAICFVLGRMPHAPTEIVFLAFWELPLPAPRVRVPACGRVAGAKPMPVLIPLMAMLFNGLNGYVNGRYLFAFGPVRDDAWFGDPRFILGALLFFAGFAVNLHADEILLHLRKPGERGYVIPFGGPFRWVTSPNYLGEIIEWSGFALLTWSPAALAFAVYTAANLAPRASVPSPLVPRDLPGLVPPGSAGRSCRSLF